MSPSESAHDQGIERGISRGSMSNDTYLKFINRRLKWPNESRYIKKQYRWCVPLESTSSSGWSLLDFSTILVRQLSNREGVIMSPGFNLNTQERSVITEGCFSSGTVSILYPGVFASWSFKYPNTDTDMANETSELRARCFWERLVLKETLPDLCGSVLGLGM